MATLLIEYRVGDFAEWKAVFDQDPMGRATHGVTAHRIYRDVDDPRNVMLSLAFASTDAAGAFRAVLAPVWEMSGARRAWVVEVGDDR